MAGIDRKPFVTAGMLLAALLSLGLSLYGCILILGLPVPPETLKDGLLELSLLSGFPLFLLSLRSVRLCTFGLWIYFIANWISWCLESVPPKFFWPTDVYAAMVLAPAVLVQLCFLVWPRNRERSPRLMDILA
jgi:hypothetical protein